MATYTLDLTYYDSNVRTFTFAVEQKSRNGWAKLRLIKITDTIPPLTEHYDPAVHDGHSHYMSHLWTARTGLTEDGASTYILYGAFGEPESRIGLIPHV